MTKKKSKQSKKKTFTKKHYSSGEGMITTIWGPNLWHYLHTISFNYPIHPTKENKKYYKQFILNLQYTLPCKNCRENLKNNFKILPLKASDLKNRESFSRYVYKLHEVVNRMLNKNSGLTYCDVRERYENFRARCQVEKKRIMTKKLGDKVKKTEDGCTEPLYGKKARSLIRIVPQKQKGKTLKIDKRCVIRR